MKKIFLACLSVCLAVAASAQKAYFLYIQTDDQAPFYLRMSDKIYSSAVSGYLILPNLTDSIYNFSIGFAKSTRPETRFEVAINQGDKGYLLKNFQEGLGLFDMQELKIIKSVSAATDKTVYETRSDRFSSILSKAADDPGLLKVPVVKKEEPKAEPDRKEAVVVKFEETKSIEEKPKDTTVLISAQAVENKEVVVAKIDTVISDSAIKPSEELRQPEAKEEVPQGNIPMNDYKPSVISRRSESSTTEGFGVVYFDKGLEQTDTIRILIPPTKNKIEDLPPVPTEEKKKDEVMVTEIPHAQLDNPEAKTEKPFVRAINTACQNIATEKDFMKLRKNMAAKPNDEEMTSEAKKAYKNKCFTTEQVRYLSTLFLSSAAKYQFFDASYNHVSDRQSFSTLQSEIKDEYYLKRFKALSGE